MDSSLKSIGAIADTLQLSKFNLNCDTIIAYHKNNAHGVFTSACHNIIFYTYQIVVIYSILGG